MKERQQIERWCLEIMPATLPHELTYFQTGGKVGLEEKQQQQQQQRAVRQLGLAWRGSEPICSFFSLVNAGAGGNLLLVQFGVV
jgi:hypothetical protein